MQAEQSESTSEMVDAVGERLEGILKIAESDPKIGPLDGLPELERQLGLDQEEVGRGDDGDDDDEEEEEEEEEEFEFSFPCGNPNSSPIAAEDAFHNGQIRPTFPFFDQSLLADVIDSDEPAASSSCSLHQPVRKLFTEGSANVCASIEPQEEYCAWEGRTVEEIPAALRQKLKQLDGIVEAAEVQRLRPPEQQRRQGRFRVPEPYGGVRKWRKGGER